MLSIAIADLSGHVGSATVSKPLRAPRQKKGQKCKFFTSKQGGFQSLHPTSFLAVSSASCLAAGSDFLGLHAIGTLFLSLAKWSGIE